MGPYAISCSGEGADGPEEAADVDSAVWNFVEFDVKGADPRVVCDYCLEELGMLSALIVAAGDEELFDERAVSNNVWTGGRIEAPPPPKLWEESVVRVMLPRSREPLEEQVAQLLEGVRAAMGLEALPAHRVVQEPVADWVSAVARAAFEPICVDGGRLWVLPAWWEGEPPEGAQSAIFIDPSCAFGDGQHQTTRLCLEWAVSNVRPGDRVLDFGCGTGILALGAMAAGAASVDGVDIALEALEASRENAARNGYGAGGPVRFYDGPDFERLCDAQPRQYDVLLANILLGPLTQLAPLFARLVRPGGSICLSGIIREQAEAVSARYRDHGFEVVEARMLDDWVCLAATRR